jgi:hypothetical protein
LFNIGSREREEFVDAAVGMSGELFQGVSEPGGGIEAVEPGGAQ